MASDTRSTSSEAAESLRAVHAFADLEVEQLAWLAATATFYRYEAGELVFEEGDAPAYMIAMLDGEIRIRRERGPSDGRHFVRRGGQITGMLPYSRMVLAPLSARAVVATRVALFPTSSFPELLQRVPVLQGRLAAIMADRVREATHAEQQREKLLGLGKLSAGLAHELNNPASAALRAAAQLRGQLDEAGSAIRSLPDGLDGATLAGLLALRAEAVTRPGPADPLERSEAEEALAAWLERRRVPAGREIAGTLAAAGIAGPRLEDATADVPAAALAPVLRWLAAEIASRDLLEEVVAATTRVARLVDVVKDYTNMDRAETDPQLDVQPGIEATLALMAARLADKGVVVRREYAAELPHLRGDPAALNQVWTHLLDNAVDAVAEGGSVTVRTRNGGDAVLVEIEDDGPGIAPEVGWRVFEPFFTTKQVGAGLGLGLDVVQRLVRAHGGDVRFESVPGRTCFEVRLPCLPPT